MRLLKAGLGSHKPIWLTDLQSRIASWPLSVVMVITWPSSNALFYFFTCLEPRQVKVEVAPRPLVSPTIWELRVSFLNLLEAAGRKVQKFLLALHLLRREEKSKVSPSPTPTTVLSESQHF